MTETELDDEANEVQRGMQSYQDTRRQNKLLKKIVKELELRILTLEAQMREEHKTALQTHIELKEMRETAIRAKAHFRLLYGHTLAAVHDLKMIPETPSLLLNNEPVHNGQKDALPSDLAIDRR